MKSLIRANWCALIALTVVPLACGPLAAQSTATFLLNSAGSGSNLGGVYTSPYTGEINGGTTIPVICDDFADDSFVPEQWTAYVTSLSSLDSGTDSNTSELNWQNSAPTVDGTLSQVQAYNAAALLSIGILTSTGTAQEEYSFALWDLFDTQAFITLTMGSATRTRPRHRASWTPLSAKRRAASLTAVV
jgi:hypothetical protein